MAKSTSNNRNQDQLAPSLVGNHFPTTAVDSTASVAAGGICEMLSVGSSFWALSTLVNRSGREYDAFGVYKCLAAFRVREGRHLLAISKSAPIMECLIGSRLEDAEVTAGRLAVVNRHAMAGRHFKGLIKGINLFAQNPHILH